MSCRSIWVCISPMQLLENQSLVKLIYSNRLTYLSLRIFWNLSLITIIPAGANQVLAEPTLVLLEPILVKVKLLNSRYWLIFHINLFWSWDNDFMNKQNTYEVTSWRGKVPAKKLWHDLSLKFEHSKFPTTYYLPFVQVQVNKLKQIFLALKLNIALF